MFQSIGIRNPIMFFIGVGQVVAGVYSFYLGDWKIGTISVLVGVANATLATMQG